MNRAKNKSSLTHDETLEEIIRLMQLQTAISLYREGINQTQIAKHLGIAKSKVVAMVHGIKKAS